MPRRIFRREYKLEAVKLVRERVVTVAQDRDLAVNENVLRKWVREHFAYIWTAEGWLNIAVVIDLFSRHVAGWSMNANMAI